MTWALSGLPGGMWQMSTLPALSANAAAAPRTTTAATRIENIVFFFMVPLL